MALQRANVVSDFREETIIQPIKTFQDMWLPVSSIASHFPKKKNTYFVHFWELLQA